MQILKKLFILYVPFPFKIKAIKLVIKTRNRVIDKVMLKIFLFLKETFLSEFNLFIILKF